MAPLPVADLTALAAGHADRADTDRVLSPEVVKALAAAGFGRHFTPARWGGADGTLTELLDAVSEVAEGCAATAWCASLTAGAARMGAYLPEQGQRDLWDDGPDVLVAGALIPHGRVEPTPGGWRLTGRWDVTSGVDFADWALVCATGEDDSPWFFAVPRTDFEVLDTWFPVGMRGTGSNTLVLDDVRVPAHRGFPRERMLHGRPTGSTARCHTAPLRVVSGVLFAAPAIGAVRGALADWTRDTAARTLPPDRARSTRIALARTAAAVDAADLLLRRAAGVADRGATPEEAVRNPRDCAFAVDLLVDAVERLFRAAGSRGQRGVVSRAWRDVHSLAGHVALQFDTAGAAYGDHALDRPAEGTTA
ncbi:two-component flavin-dependent monooxygenase [Saccharothrix carnea]|uniref:Two-component flavin-dependent monooxygenase n=1 Tax=Saccharothrix carnea TaxID=1280637 RepID=A0A2P8I2J4_SACCR|nr:acyl-CoA dehydrogenase family protein [Saccharothrix carnea]PSL52683.1 two-component flavin-dependent monooxygenase [Saccharothrix carnea]